MNGEHCDRRNGSAPGRDLRKATVRHARDDLSAALFNLSPAAHLLLEEGVIVEYNAAAMRLLGDESVDPGGRSLGDFVEGEGIVTSSGAGHMGTSLLRLRRHDGELVEVQLESTDVEVAGRAMRLVVMHEVRRIQTPQGALSQGHQLAIALEAGRMGTWSIDPVIGTFCGDVRAHEIFGRRCADGYSMALEEAMTFVHADDRDDLDTRLTVALSRPGAEFDHEFRFEWSDGTIRWVRMRGRNTASDFEHPRLSGIVWDVSEHRLVQTRLRESELRFRTLADSTPAGVYVMCDGRLSYVNPALARLFGYAPEEMVGRHAYEFIIEADRAIFKEHLRRRIAGEVDSVRYNVRGVRRDGSEVILDVLGAMATISGDPVVIGTALDVTEVIASGRRLKDSEARYRALSDLVHCVGFTVAYGDGHPRLSWLTSSVETVLGYSASFLEDHWISIVHPDDRQIAVSLRNAVRSGRQTTTELRAHHADGTVRWLRIGVFPELDEREGRVVCVNGAAQDITAQKNIQLELICQKDRAQEMARLKDAFLANMSHEIRTPLASIIGAADILQEEVEGDLNEMVGFIRRGGERLMETLSSVLDLAQLQGRSIELHPEHFNAATEVEKALELVRLRATSRGLSTDLIVEGSEPVVVFADRIAFGRVLSNLLSNALKFTEKGGIAVRICRDEDTVRIDVEDTGIGIGPDFIDRVFDEFSQESNGQTRTHEGNGLGLAISKQLVDTLAVISAFGVLRKGVPPFLSRYPEMEVRRRIRRCLWVPAPRSHNASVFLLSMTMPPFETSSAGTWRIP